MTPEEFVERIKKGLIKPETRGGAVIMVDEQKGEYGFEFYKLEDLPQRISVKRDRAYLEKAVPWYPIYFDLIVGSKMDKGIPIKSIRCRVKCNYIPLQVIDWRQGDEFATNGLEVRGIRSLPALSETRISIPFNPYICPKIPEGNRWDLDGYVEFDSPLGEFKKHFSLDFYKLREEDWQILFPLKVSKLEI